MIAWLSSLLIRCLGRNTLRRLEASSYFVLDNGYIAIYGILTPLRWVRSLYQWFENRRLLRQFGRVGRNCAIRSPERLRGVQYVTFGDGVYVFPHSRWDIGQLPPPSPPPRVQVGSRCNIGHYFLLACSQEVEIGENVLIANSVFITDTNHAYQDPSCPIKTQGGYTKGKTIIEDNCWLGYGSVILGGVTVGRNSVVGANAVVTHSVPPCSVVAGNPARVIRRYDSVTQSWVRVDPK